MTEPVLDPTEPILKIRGFILDWFPELLDRWQGDLQVDSCAAQIMDEMTEDFRFHGANWLPLTEYNYPNTS